MLWMCAALAADVVAVLPFASNAVRPELLPLGAATTDMLVTDLTRIPGVVVVERARIHEVLAELQLQSSGFVDPESAVRVGQGLGANLVVVGSVNTASVGLRIDARVVDVATGQATMGASSTGAEADFFALESDVAAQLYAYFGAELDVQEAGKPKTLEGAVEGGVRLEEADEAYLRQLRGVQTYRRERLFRTSTTADEYVVQRGAGAVLSVYDLTEVGLLDPDVMRRPIRRNKRLGWLMLGGGAAMVAGGTTLVVADNADQSGGWDVGLGLILGGSLTALFSIGPLSKTKQSLGPDTWEAFGTPGAADAEIDQHNRAMAGELGVSERRRLEIEAERVTP